MSDAIFTVPPGAIPDWALRIAEPKWRYIGIFGGRDSTKSHSTAAMLVKMAYESPTRILCGREYQNSIRNSSKRLIDDKIKALGLSDSFRSTDTEIHGPNGSLFVFSGLHHNIGSIRSIEGIDVAWIEEAQYVSQHSLDTMIPTIFRRAGSKIIFTFNPELPSNPVDRLLRGENPPPNTLLISVNYDSNVWLSDESRAEIAYMKKNDYQKYLHVYCGEYQTRSEARVFKNWRVEPFDGPSNAIRRQGADWGYSVDPSVLVQCYLDGRRLYVEHEAYMVGCETDDLPALFGTVLDSEVWPIVADSARPETISFLKRHGYPKIMSAAKGKNSIKEGIEFLQSKEIIVHPRCTHTIDELTNYSFKVDPLTGEVLPILEDKKNHVIDALRYAVEGVRRAEKVRAIEAPKAIAVPNVKSYW